MKRTPTDKEYAHERLGAHFATALSNYDTQRRVEVLIDDFLANETIKNRSVLDVGCGLGFFSDRLHQLGGEVIACDLGPNLVAETRSRVGCRAVVADALNLKEQFGSNQFDFVVSSECIEHTPDPAEAIRQMIAVTKPGGLISISTPNILWSPVVKLATRLKLRPFDGLENFSAWPAMRRVFSQSGATVCREKGLHLFPFQLPLHSVSRWCDENLQSCRYLMINICILARKLQR